MSHATEDDLVLLHYGEATDPAARDHVASCPECAARLRALGEVLALARAPEAPARGEDYERRVWEGVRRRLATQRRVGPAPRRWPRLVPALGVLATAAALVLAFLLGREFPSAPRPLPPQARERVLLVAVGDHLERARMMLVEVQNASPDEPLDLSAQREFADELVLANRLYRQASVRSGEPALAAVLEELERVLVELAAGPGPLSASDLAELQRRIEARGLLFKVRVIESRVREREKESWPARGVSS